MSIVKVVSDENKHDGDVAFIIAHDEYIYTGGSDGKVKVRDKKFSSFKTFSSFFRT